MLTAHGLPETTVSKKKTTVPKIKTTTLKKKATVAKRRRKHVASSGKSEDGSEENLDETSMNHAASNDG